MVAEIQDLVALSNAVRDQDNEVFNEKLQKVNNDIQGSGVTTNAVSASLVSDGFGSEGNQNALVDFIKSLFGIKDESGKSTQVNGSYEDFQLQLDTSRGIVTIGNEVPAGVGADPVVPSEENNLLRYTNAFVSVALEKRAEGFDNQELTNKIQLKNEDGKFKIVLPKELYEAYQAIDDEGKQAIINNVKGEISKSRSEGQTDIPVPAPANPNTEEVAPKKGVQGRIEGAKTIEALEGIVSNGDLRSGLNYTDTQMSRGVTYSLRGEEHNISLIRGEREGYKEHYGKMISDEDNLIKGWADYNKGHESDLSKELNKLVKSGKKYSEVSEGEGYDNLKKYMEEHKEDGDKLVGYINKRDQLFEDRTSKISKCDELESKQLDYAKAKVSEMASRGEYNKSFEQSDEKIVDFKNKVLDHRSAERGGWFKRPETDVTGSIKDELKSIRPGNGLGEEGSDLTISGLKGAVVDELSRLDGSQMSQLVGAKGSYGKVIKGLGIESEYLDKCPQIFETLAKEIVDVISKNGTGPGLDEAISKSPVHKALGEVEKSFEKEGEKLVELNSRVEKVNELKAETTQEISMSSALGRKVDNFVSERSSSHEEASTARGNFFKKISGTQKEEEDGRKREDIENKLDGEGLRGLREALSGLKSNKSMGDNSSVGSSNSTEVGGLEGDTSSVNSNNTRDLDGRGGR